MQYSPAEEEGSFKMSDKKKNRIAGRAWNTIRHLKKLIEEATEDFTKWQRGLFDPGQPLEKFYPDQIKVKLTRIAAAGDAYAGECKLCTFGLHVQVDTMGSRQLYIK